jgi:signal transduction histidine kinase
MTVTEAEAEADLRASRARIVAASNEARRALERRLHDGPQQHLTAIAVKLRLIEQAVDESPQTAKEMLADLRREVQETVQQLREVASSVFPPLLTDRGLSEALRAAAGRSATESHVTVSASRRYPAEIEAGIYFACIEAMHRGDVTVDLVEVDGALELVLTGDLDGARTLIEDRICTVGGSIRAEARSITATVPLG